MSRRKNTKKNAESQETGETEAKEGGNKESKLSWIGGGIALLALVFLVFYYVFQGWGVINYEGLRFTKQAYGENLITGNLIVYHYAYYFKGPENQAYKSNIYLRHDPRKNKVPVEGEIVFGRAQPAYISVDAQALRSCNDSVIAVATLSQFLAHNLFIAKGATPDAREAAERNITYATCTTHPENTVLLLQPGARTAIAREDNCYKIEVSQCEIQQAVEKFIVQSL